MQVVLGSSREHEPRPAGVRHLSRGRDPRDRKVHVVDRRVRLSGEVLDGAAGQPRPDRQRDGVGDILRFIGEPVLEVRGHRKVRCRHDRCGMGERLVSGHRSVEAAERRGKTPARRGQGFEAEGGEQLRRTCVPRVWKQERAHRTMQREESLALGLWRVHAANVPEPSVAAAQRRERDHSSQVLVSSQDLVARGAGHLQRAGRRPGRQASTDFTQSDTITT